MRSIDPTSDRPVYQQVADLLRGRILDGSVRPGERMPSEAELMGEFGVSRTTARLAHGVLRTEGLADARRGRGVFVRGRAEAQRVASDRYRLPSAASWPTAGAPGAGAGPAVPGDRPATAFTHDQGIAWPDYRLDARLDEVAAPAEVAGLLGLDEGTPVLARRFVFHAAGVPRQASRSYLPLDLVAGTPVADPANEPWPGGTIAQLASLGVAVTRVEESVRARMPTPDERRALQVAPGVPVITVTRRMLAGDRPVEAAADIVMPADRVVLDYAIDLP